MDHLAIDLAVVGGISLGSAVAVNVALRYPDRVMGLVLSRPAWLGGPVRRNVELYATIARLIRELGPEAGLERFVRTREFREMESESPDCARSLIGQFEAAEGGGVCRAARAPLHR
jgi:pimeloyl-ACP methyl ester carboxylesterase